MVCRCYNVPLFCFINVAWTAVIFTEEKPPTRAEVSFMKRFGYLPEDELSSKYAYTAQSVAEAVRKLQAFAGVPVTGVLDDTTKQLLHARRCGVKDIDTDTRKRRYALKQGWQKNKLTYKVTNGSSTIRKERVEELMRAALEAWAPYGGLQFSRTDRDKADIEITFTTGQHGDWNPFDGPGNIVAHAFPPPHGGMHFDDDETWGEEGEGEGGEYQESGGDEEVTDFYSVALHEAGHALGLSHSAVRGAIMFPYYQGPGAQLAEDDISGMYELYLKSPLPSSMSILKTEKSPQQKPHLCSTGYDIMAVIRNKIFVFKDEWLWILDDRKVFNPGHPVLLTEIFKDIPADLKLDAVYERRDGQVVIFYGQNYILLDDRYQYTNTGRLLDYSLPEDIQRIECAFLSNYNNKTYLFQKEDFYRFNEDTWSRDEGYPRSMSAWRNIPTQINSVIVWMGDTYLFKGPNFWRFDNERIIAHPNYPVPTAQFWFGCPENSGT